MTTAVEVLQWAIAAGFVLLGLLAVVAWRRERDRHSAALALALGSLALVTVLGRVVLVLPELAGGVVPVESVLFLLSGLGLLLFRHSFLPLHPVGLRLIVALLVVVGSAAVILEIAGATSAPGPLDFAVVVAMVAAWLGTALEPAVRFWLAGRHVAQVQRARLHALSLAILGIILLLLLAVASTITAAVSSPAISMASEVIAIALVPLMAAAVAPPGWLRRRWRQREEGNFRRAVEALLLGAEDPAVLVRGSLSWAMQLVGADVGIFARADREVLAAIGVADADASDEIATLVFPDRPDVRRKGRRLRLLVPVPLHEGAGLLMLQGGDFTPFFGDDEVDRMRQYVAVLAPAIDRLDLLAELRRSEADLRDAIQARTDFMNAIVHDMRGPLTVSSGYIEMLGDGTFGDLPAAAERPVQTIASKLVEMRKLVDDLLLCARIESGTLPVNAGVVDLRNLAAEAVDRVRPAAELRRAKIDITLPDAPVPARADRDLVARILDNLVNNALAYGGDPAEITVSVQAGAEPAIVVADHGPGIPEDLRNRLFQRFVRGRTGGTGSGLGLYLSRELASCQGGTLGLDDGAGGGARFHLGLPPVEPESAVETPAADRVA